MTKFFLLGLVFCTILSAQDNSEKLKDLEQDFASFNYELVLQKGQFILSDTYTTSSDSLKVFTYMLNSAYALNDTSQAKGIIISILHTDPHYSLNPKKTSPKIIEFFNLVKSEENLFPQRQVKEPKTTPAVKSIDSPWISVSSVLLPGSGHLIKGEKQKGYLNTAISTALISGIIISHVKTNDNMDRYLKANGAANFNSLYDDYNAAYKMRSVMIGAYVLWGLYNLFEINNKNQRFSLATNFNRNTSGLVISYSF